MPIRKVLILTSAVLMFSPDLASATELLSYKDQLFNYTRTISTTDNGDFIELEFNEMRDVNGRDEIPVQKARAEYVELSKSIEAKDKTIGSRFAKISTFEVGTVENSKFAVIFIHGGGGSKELGVKDWSFGGNFNRLKHLTVQNGGVYYSPTVSFDQNGIAGVGEIIKHVKQKSASSKVIVACGSAGSFICWSLLGNESSTQLSGLILLGGAIAPPAHVLKMAGANNLPIIFSHGSRDGVLPWQNMHAGYRYLKQISSAYPTRFVLYQTGGHGTPIRMIDWRESINLILNYK